jgi:hypothetical protein
MGGWWGHIIGLFEFYEVTDRALQKAFCFFLPCAAMCADWKATDMGIQAAQAKAQLICALESIASRPASNSKAQTGALAGC